MQPDLKNQWLPLISLVKELSKTTPSKIVKTFRKRLYDEGVVMRGASMGSELIELAPDFSKSFLKKVISRSYLNFLLDKATLTYSDNTRWQLELNTKYLRQNQKLLSISDLIPVAQDFVEYVISKQAPEGKINISIQKVEATTTQSSLNPTKARIEWPEAEQENFIQTLLKLQNNFAEFNIMFLNKDDLVEAQVELHVVVYLRHILSATNS